MTLSEYKKMIIQKLLSHSDTPQLDAELILMHALKKTRAQLLMALNDLIETNTLTDINLLVARRSQGEPMAYLLGHQPFWTMDLIVTKDTLIPRPETECLIEWVLENFSDTLNLTVADLGTGTGAIALSLALEKPRWKIDATDFSSSALTVATKNAEKYDIKNINFYEGDWCDALQHQPYDIIISNPPYIAAHDLHLEKLQFEPQTALVSGATGLNAIEKIVHQAPFFLKAGGALIIEHGFDQAETVKTIFAKAGFKEIKTHPDLAGNARFTTGKI